MGAKWFCIGLCSLVSFDVRVLRIAITQLLAEQDLGRGGSFKKRLTCGRGVDGGVVGGDGRALCGGAVGWSFALYWTDRRCHYRWRCALLHGFGHGCAIAGGGAFGRNLVAEVRAVDGGGKKSFWRCSIGYGAMDCFATYSNGCANGYLGVVVDRSGDFHACARFLAAARYRLASFLERDWRRYADRWRCVSAWSAERCKRPFAAAGRIGACATRLAF